MLSWYLYMGFWKKGSLLVLALALSQFAVFSICACLQEDLATFQVFPSSTLYCLPLSFVLKQSWWHEKMNHKQNVKCAIRDLFLSFFFIVAALLWHLHPPNIASRFSFVSVHLFILFLNCNEFFPFLCIHCWTICKGILRIASQIHCFWRKRATNLF